jgi:hypothetical protein
MGKPRLQFRRDDEDIQASELARTMASEPRTTKDKLKDIPVTPGNYRKFLGGSQNPLPKGIMWGVAGIIIIFVGGFIASYYVVRENVVREISSRAAVLAQGVNDLQNFDPKSAEARFKSLSDTPDLGSLASAFGFLFQGSVSAFQSFTDISQQLTSLSADTLSLQNTGFSFFSTGDGGSFIANLTSIKQDLAAIDADSNTLASAVSSAGASSSVGGFADSYLPLKTQVEGAENFLNAFIPWLANPAPHHMLVMLQNPSEEKPAGGFLGSYADVTIASGTITNIAVHDIADVDIAFKPNIVPPLPLQLETTRFRPADANWFFDFPTSASETISMFEQSNLYAASGTKFDGAIAISPKIISDLLSLTGPVSVGKPTTTFTSDNLVVQIQKLVQAGQSSGASYPKKVLPLLASAIFGKFTASSTASSSEAQLAHMISNWSEKKDVMAYFKNPTFENFVGQYGMSGDVYQLPQRFSGDYLAVVNSDINGDKSELYVSQSINFDAEIGTDGTVSNHLIIDRKDTGDQSPYPWYQTTNQDYLQIFVSPGSSIQNESGGVVRTVPAPINYAKAGYSTDPLVATIETSTLQLFTFPAVITQQQFGKNVFAVWSRTRAGTKTQISFDYSHHLFATPADGVQYQFVFEKQAGTTGSYQFEIDAPLGYVFAESGLPAYIYSSNDPPGRMIVTLTLESLNNH